MPTAGTFEQLLAQRVLMVNPSPQLLAASKELENSPLGKPGRFDHLVSDDDWAEMRSGVWPMGPFNQAWADKGADRAEQLTFEGPQGSVDIRVVRPSGKVRGALFHTHGGGWVANSPASFDYKHAQAAEWCGLVVGCVDWRKAPQHPYPAALDDLEAGALWFSEYVKNEYGVDSLYLRGESSGGNTGAATMLRMKQKHGFNFSGAVLDIGCFDMTAALPSHTEYDDRNQSMDSVSVDQMFDLYLKANENRRDPELSPMYGNLSGLPPVLFNVCDLDPLRDGAFLMFMRWLAANDNAYLVNYRGVGHVMGVLDCPEIELEARLAARFLNHLLDQRDCP